ncbi:MAG: hypothetical protein MUD03_08605 [Pirellula sp.]|jgi:hypothetical protein|nr:hypothetical protein [Pirellula sp.]
MADDLDEFLRQAAERRKNRQQQKSARPPISQPPVVAQPVQEPVPTLRPLAPTDVYDQPLPSAQGSSAAPPPLAPPREEPSRFPSQFDRPAPPAPSPAAKQKKNKPRNTPSQKPAPTLPPVIPSLAPSPELTAAPDAPLLSNLNIRDQIRNPQSLKAAIILHEILKRPWQ